MRWNPPSPSTPPAVPGPRRKYWRWALVLAAAGTALLLVRSRRQPDEVPSLPPDEQILRAAQVGTDPEALAAYFRKRTLTPAGQRVIDRLIGQLGHRAYRIRHQASRGLSGRGAMALPALRVAVNDADLEVARRAERAVHRIMQAQSPAVTAAAVRLLVQKKPETAAATLLAFVPFAENDAVAEEILSVLTAQAAGAPQIDPALHQALTDANGIRRAVAAEVLCRAGLADKQPAVHQLLHDPDPAVSCRVALALGRAHDKNAIPVLIELLPRLPAAAAYRALDFLYEVAEDDAPALPLGVDEAGRGRCHQAWREWWHKHGGRIDLAHLGGPQPVRGYTMLVLLDAGKVVERDAKGQRRWQVAGLRLPLDAQLLPGQRLLVAEHGANRVTERNLRGQVLWEMKVDGPLVAQRLSDGHTFIATRTKLFEVDRAGAELYRLPAPGGDMIMRACKLPGGDIACVTMGRARPSQFLRLSGAGNPKHRQAVNVSTYGGRIEVLPDNHVLVAEMAHNRVVEYDAQGKVTWQARVIQPVAAVRLANGHTLVTTYAQNRAIEFDRDGTEVGDVRADTRVTRAWRR